MCPKRGERPVRGASGQEYRWTFPVALVVKNPPPNAGAARDLGSISGLARSPGGGRGNPPQYSCLGNPMDRGAWRDTGHRVAELDTTEMTWHTCTDGEGYI